MKMDSMIKLVALDFDGTTADTMPTLENIAVRLLVENYQLEEEDAREKYRRTTGLPFEQQIGMIFPDNPINHEVISQFEKEKIEGIFNLPLFEDAKDTISTLRSNGFLVAISSSTTQPTIEKYCQIHDLYVDQILGYREGFEKGKDHFNFLFEKFAIESNEVVYVGDSLKDCERAQGSNILFIARIGMFNEEQFNQISKSKIAINNLNELILITKKMNEQ